MIFCRGVRKSLKHDNLKYLEYKLFFSVKIFQKCKIEVENEN
ncbi:MAG: Unknown protein [uncultured Sulfurovum sp.]|uniref:Uncharacterized protein n=1 Tax=uncultured Sulfurovum sp. TaxID=269237 RepID=A0A6S6T2E1_9BACT|nr:MAG: Unknown protein [uncultured Sulfurovum sp.]